jgi:hypothetical protein
MGLTQNEKKIFYWKFNGALGGRASAEGEHNMGRRLNNNQIYSISFGQQKLEEGVELWGEVPPNISSALLAGKPAWLDVVKKTTLEQEIQYKERLSAVNLSCPQDSQQFNSGSGCCQDQLDVFVQHNAHVPIMKNGGAASHKMGEDYKLTEKEQQQPMEVDSEPLPGPSTVPPTSTLPIENRSKFTPAGLRMLEAIWGFESLSGIYTRIVRVHPSVPLAPPPSSDSATSPTAGPSREHIQRLPLERQWGRKRAYMNSGHSGYCVYLIIFDVL